MWSLSLLANLFADNRDDPLSRPEVIWGTLGLMLALLAGAGVIYAVDKWRKRATAAPTDADEAGALTSYRAMYENGEITEAEYAELRRRVADKVKRPSPKTDPNRPATPTMPTSPAQPGERATVHPPAPPSGAPESPPPPSTA